jgi:hypothetical protein
MNRYILIRRLRGPAFLLLVGVNALLAQANILGWSQSWPFYLILAGVLLLAERAALASEGYPQQYPGMPGAGVNTQGAAQDAGTSETALLSKRHEGFENDATGGQQ